MIFKDMQRASPVTLKTDLPGARDMFYESPQDIPYKTKKDFASFVRKFVQDKVWWERQRTHCIYGVTIPNAVDLTVRGDSFIDGVNMDVLPDGSRYIRHLDYLIPPTGDIWIPGRLYFYLNFFTISIEDKLQHSKTPGRPWFTDLSWENWMLRERARREFKDTCFSKTRQRGLSSEEACDHAWVWFFMNGVQTAITSGVDIYNDTTYLMIKDGIKKLANTAFFKTIEYDNDEKFTTKYTGIEIINRTANGNSEVLNGLNKLYKAHLEEFGIMSEGLATEIIKNVRPSIKTGGNRRTGFIVLTGTSGKKDEKGRLTVNNMADLEKFTYNPEANGFLSLDNVYDGDPPDDRKRICCFIPAWKFRVMDEHGNSLKQASIDQWTEELNLLPKKDQPAFKQLDPMTTTDMFNIIPGGFFGDYISDKCNMVRNLIITHKSKNIIERGFLKPKNPRNIGEGVEWVPNQDEGDIFVIAGEHPRTQEVTLTNGKKIEEVVPGLYLQGTDSYDMTEANTSSSKLCSLIFKMVDKRYSISAPEMGIMNNLVAGYIGRPTEEQGGREAAYENAAKLSVYFQTLNMIEYTKILIFDYYEQIGLEGFLAPRPDLVIVSNIDRSMVSNKYGMPSILIPHMLTKLRDWLLIQGNIENIPFDFVLKAFSEFKRAKHYNCDITMAMVSLMSQFEEYLLDMEEEKKDERPPQRYKGFQMVGGRLQECYS